MLADITITIPTQVIHAAAWFAIGAATVVVALLWSDVRARKSHETEDQI
jgi:hypothetical protein